MRELRFLLIGMTMQSFIAGLLALGNVIDLTVGQQIATGVVQMMTITLLSIGEKIFKKEKIK